MSRIVAAVASALLLVLVAPASAAQRFVTTGGSVSSDCSQAAPCSLARAAQLANGSTGDEVIVAPGDYQVGASPLDATGDTSGGLSIHGIRGFARPRLIGTGSTVLSVGRASLSHLEIVGSVDGLSVGAGGTYDDLAATTSGPGDALLVTDPTMGGTAAARITNTVAHATGNGRAIYASQANIDLDNVTAWTDGSMGNVAGVLVAGGNSTGSPPPLTAALRNVVAHAGSGSDDVAICTSGQAVTITIVNSAYANSALACGSGTINDSGGHVTLPPLFVDAPGGDFHQQPLSPTIDAGSPASFEPSDFDLQARPFGAAPDIGADELTVGVGQARAYTEHADAVIPTGSVTLHGAVNAGGGAATYRFAYGTDAGLAGASRTPDRAASGLATVPVTEPAAGIRGVRTYYYRLEAVKGAVLYPGETRSFTVGSVAPTAATGVATSLSATSARLTGVVGTNGDATQVFFQFGIAADYGAETGGKLVSDDAGDQAVAATVGNLPAGITLHYRLKAVNAKGTTYGADRSVVLPPAATPTDNKPPLLSALLSGKVDRRGRVLLTLSTDDDSPPVHVAVTLRAGKRVVGRGALTPARGGPVNVRIRLDPRARRDLKRHRRLRVSARLVATDARGNARRRTISVTLRR